MKKILSYLSYGSLIIGVASGMYALTDIYLIKSKLPYGICPVTSNKPLIYIAIVLCCISFILSFFEPRVKDLEESIQKMQYSYRETVAAASAAIDARDSYTAGHSRRVAEIVCKVGRELGLEDSKLECLELAALLHDIGKIGIPDCILNKPGRLDEDEFKKIKEHPTLGYNILVKIESLSPMLPAILYHHERPDGKGYPEGLKGDKIPIGASIIAIADTYDAMTSDRPYRDSLSHELAIEELKKHRGTQLGKEVVDAFLKTHI